MSSPLLNNIECIATAFTWVAFISGSLYILYKTNDIAQTLFGREKRRKKKKEEPVDIFEGISNLFSGK